MQWNKQQDAALKAVGAWIKDPNSQQVFKLFGYAGTGKTTLAKHFAKHVRGRVLFAAYTGKAAHVLKTKGCHNARTIHSLIYLTSEKSKKVLKELETQLAEIMTEKGRKEFPDEKAFRRAAKNLESKIELEKRNVNQPRFTLDPNSEVKDATLLIIDECSMVGGRMGEDLLSFGVKILVLGDPFQLPPVGDGGFFTNGEPDVMLTDVMRQAQDNPVLYLATMIRENHKLDLGDYGESKVVNRKLPAEQVLQFDQMLVGKNATRTSANKRFRELKQFQDDLPVVGDKLVCLKNNHDLGLLNGSLWEVRSAHANLDIERTILDIAPEDGGLGLGDVVVATHHFEGKKLPPYWELDGAEQFDYGYCLTTHKAQGSQWNSVLVYDEGGIFRNDRWRWLYTAVTRAAESVSVVKFC